MEIALVLLFAAAGACVAVVYLARRGRLPVVTFWKEWSIGVYTGTSPFRLAAPKGVANPVLTSRDVTDVPCHFVADPFLVQRDSTWYMFFEVMNRETGRGEIGLASSPDAIKWTYERVVLREPFHLSYPYAFESEGEYYMLPESYAAKAVRLYKADKFPTDWSCVKTLLSGSDFVDASVFQFGGMWWMFTSSTSNEDLRLFHARDLTADWVEHPMSPVVTKDARIARPAGRVLHYDGRLLRFAQDDSKASYGSCVRCFEILDLTPSMYRERHAAPLPILKRRWFLGWNGIGMHHLDLHRHNGGEWIGSVDGSRLRITWSRKRDKKA